MKESREREPQAQRGESEHQIAGTAPQAQYKNPATLPPTSRFPIE